MMVNYKFNEGALIDELLYYIDSTYDKHYGGQIQTSEIMLDRDRGLEFFLGNIDKYSLRYGKKGSIDDQRNDLMKIAHYSILALYAHDKKYGVQTDESMVQLDMSDYDTITLTNYDGDSDISFDLPQFTIDDGALNETFTINLDDSK